MHARALALASWERTPRARVPVRSRDDTVRCIVMSLTGQDETDGLAEELELTTSAGTLPDRADVELSDYEDENWMPDPVDADLCAT